eukprot:CAMPEP_0171121820 /NCGR_PEP_ID=MMETSP0766_2-20121228/103492_1 /TAXON_ID=439317 /ORGANISM="Gambierdiscus australes, Strain CAWD 149" /LENGTH=65 /DNA_ID=CAMNT_0011584625 /DNA_START=10 /DNA_END=203 /DNA_ORIENTATION=-
MLRPLGLWCSAVVACIAKNGTESWTKEVAAQPAQMTQEWWDVHYSTVFQSRGLTGDPRRPGYLGV